MASEFNIDKFMQELDFKLNVFDLKSAAGSADSFRDFLLKSDEQFPLKKAERILQMLRNKRMFLPMQQVADALIQTNRSTFKIQRQYAQALIDSGNYTAAVMILQALISETAKAPLQDVNAVAEIAEAKGLIGRVYKQLYINANNPSNIQCIHFLTLAINAYHDVYKADNGKVWHGINTVALLERAKRDKIVVNNSGDPMQMAKTILETVENRYFDEKADAWDFATAAEACIALNKPEEALKWISGYARMPYCDAFELGSTLRQYEEVWQLDLDSSAGKLVLPILRAELIKRMGGNMVLGVEEIKKQQAMGQTIEATYNNLVQQTPINAKGEIKLEKVFGEDSFKTYKWYMTGAYRCLAVARIGLDPTRGHGTGFLVKGSDLKEALGDELFLLTNAHVVSDNLAEQRALRPDQVTVIFEAVDRDVEFRDFTIYWSSPSSELDATLLRFSEEGQLRLKELMKDVILYPLAKVLPAIEKPPTQKTYIIGHPFGGTLQISFQDNLLIDHEAPKVHYRTPTEGGSSGSPVFNQVWDLIALHHAGSEKMPCLHGEPGATYAANEGIWIQSIRKAIP